jgi:hypothetical protein
VFGLPASPRAGGKRVKSGFKRIASPILGDPDWKIARNKFSGAPGFLGNFWENRFLDIRHFSSISQKPL